MAIISPATYYEGHEVEVLDVYECGGIELATVEAIHGKPFVGGDKWAVWTPFKVVRVDELDECSCDESPNRQGMACRACRERIDQEVIPF